MSLAPDLSDPKFLKFVAERATPEERQKFAPYLQAAIEEARYDWEPRLREKQRWPEGDWNVELKLAGRGFGKSLAGAVWVKKMLLENPGCRIAIVAPTSQDTRDTCVEGDSGLLGIINPKDLKTWNRSLGELIMNNGSRVKTFTGDEPERLRGPQHHGAWVDELAAFRYPAAWDQLQFGLRLGDKPQVMITTTPRPTKLIRELMAREDVHVTTGSTFENSDNLAPSMLAELQRQYNGTRLGRQELYAELLLDTPGALFTYEILDANRVLAGPDQQRIVVGVDPSGGSGDENDWQGIVVAGKGVDGHGYVLADRSCRMSPAGWGARSVKAYLDYEADLIVVEKNFGGDMAMATIYQAAKDMGVKVNVKTVTSSRGKVVRAEPTSSFAEQGNLHLVGSFPELEDTLTTWTPDSGVSPDRLDALVFAMNEMFFNGTGGGLRFRGR